MTVSRKIKAWKRPNISHDGKWNNTMENKGLLFFEGPQRSFCEKIKRVCDQSQSNNRSNILWFEAHVADWAFCYLLYIPMSHVTSMYFLLLIASCFPLQRNSKTCFAIFFFSNRRWWGLLLVLIVRCFFEFLCITWNTEKYMSRNKRNVNKKRNAMITHFRLPTRSLSQRSEAHSTVNVGV